MTLKHTPIWRHHWVVLRWLRLPIIRDWLAITIGDWTFSREPLTYCERVHEMEHAYQWADFGWRFPLYYVRASWRAHRAGKDWYRGNVFEVQAYDLQAECEVDIPRSKAPSNPPSLWYKPW